MTEHQSPVMMDSTELLINGQWQTGTIQCRKQESILISSSAIFV